MLPAGIFVPLTEGTWFHASAQARALVEPAEGECDNNEDQRCCYNVRHKMNSPLLMILFLFKLDLARMVVRFRRPAAVTRPVSQEVTSFV